jgi:hypothetical protein
MIDALIKRVSFKFGLKGILSTKILFFPCPKLLSFSVPTFIKWRLTQRYDFLTKKTQNYRYRNYCLYIAFVPFGKHFTSIHLSLWIRQSSFSSTRWHFLFFPRTTCCLLFLNSAHVSRRVHIEGHMNRFEIALKWHRFCLIGKPSMFFPSFLNRFSYFMNI